MGADGQTTAPDIQEGAFFELCENMRVTQSAFGGVLGKALKALGGDNIEVSDVRAGADATGAVELACSVGLAFDGCKNLTIGSDEDTTVVGGETAIMIENVTEGQNTIKNVHAGGGISGISQLFSTKVGLFVKNCANLGLTGKPGDAMTPENNSLINGTETAAEIEDSESITLERFSIGTDGASSGGTFGINAVKILNSIGTQVGSDKAGCHLHALNGVFAKGLQAGGTTKLENLFFNIQNSGQGIISAAMQTGLVAEDCDDMELNQLHLGAMPKAMDMLRCRRMRIKNPYIGISSVDGRISFDVQVGLFALDCSKMTIGDASDSAFVVADSAIELTDCDQVTAERLQLGLSADGLVSLGNMQKGIQADLCSNLVIRALKTGGFSGTAVKVTDSTTIKIDDVAIGLNADATEAFPVDTGLAFERCTDVLVGLEDFINRITAKKAVMIDDLQAAGPEGNTIRNMHIGLAANGAALGAIDTAIDVNNASDLSLDSFRISQANLDGLRLRLSERVRLENSWFGVGLDPETNFQIGGDAVRVEGSSEVGLVGNFLRNALGSGLRVDSQSSNIMHRKNLIYDNAVAPVIGYPPVLTDSMTSILSNLNLKFNGTLLEGTITGPPNTTVTLDIYATDPGAPFVESRYHLGSEEITFDDAGNATPATALEGTAPPGWEATFTLTDSTLGTTDFSPAMSVTAAADRDHDGLPDFWEERYPTILDPDDDSDAGEDPDGDGRDNTQEFVEWTDPGHADVPPQPGLTLAPDSVEIAVEVKSGRYYTLQRSPTLGLESWEDIETRYLVNGGQMTLVDPEPVPGAKRMFYRILTELPYFE